MSKIRLPEFLTELPDGPHKRDLIRQFVKKERRRRKNEKSNL